MNRLANETSPYLLQHKYNPVDWYPWGEEALQKAAAPLREFMLGEVREKDLLLFLELTGAETPESPEDVPMSVLIPSFVVGELKTAFQIGFVLFLEGGHTAHLVVNGTDFPYIPQWIVIFILMLMFAVDLYQNWWERKMETDPVQLHHREK